MKTHEMAAVMEMSAKILRELPNEDLIDSLEQLLKLARANRSRSRFSPDSMTDVPSISHERINDLAHMPSAEIEELLTTSEEFSSLRKIRELANHLGIKMSRRQNHAALVNMIVKYFEARRMDFTIRSGQNKDETSRNSQLKLHR